MKKLIKKEKYKKLKNSLTKGTFFLIFLKKIKLVKLKIKAL